MMSSIGPVFGWDAPHQASTKCSDPEFADKYAHRVYIIPVQFHSGGLSGFRTQKKCVGCGERFDHGFFYPLGQVREQYPEVLEDIGFEQNEWIQKDDPVEIPDYKGDVRIEYEPLGSPERARPDERAIIQRLENALKLIEQIVNGAYGAYPTDDVPEVVQKVYHLAHTARVPSCIDSHPEWEQQFQKLVDEHIDDEDESESALLNSKQSCVYCDRIIVGDPGYHHAENHPEQEYKPAWYMGESDHPVLNQENGCSN